MQRLVKEDPKLMVAVIAAAAAVAMAVGALGLYAHDVQDRRVASARTALENCRQIELIKTQIRDTVNESVAHLPTVAYYRIHPRELRQAIANARRSVMRFHPVDCYRLPSVRGSVSRP